MLSKLAMTINRSMHTDEIKFEILLQIGESMFDNAQVRPAFQGGVNELRFAQ